MDTAVINPRQERGLALAKGRAKLFRQISGDMFLVPSATNSGSGYVVDAVKSECTCPDYETHRDLCKHLWALRYFRHEVQMPDGTTVVTETVERISYSQDWRAYNAAQCTEKEVSQVLLRSLCDTIVTPPHPGRGPKPIPLADAVYGMATKVYTTVSGRRATTDIKACKAAGLMTRQPHYNSIFNYCQKPELTPVLTSLVELAATPLKAIEHDFAADATGFATPTYVRWFDYKHGEDRRVQKWVKCHAMIGTVTNIITSVAVTDGTVHDSPVFKTLVERTAAHGYDMKEISADKGYLSHANLAIVEGVGATPFVPFKLNSKSMGSPAWERMFHYYSLNKEDFLAHYHKRSNVESTFGAMKKKFGAALRSKLPVAQVNEVLLKCLCFNLSTLVHSIYEFNIEPKFWLPPVANGASQ
jgi:transposase